MTHYEIIQKILLDQNIEYRSERFGDGHEIILDDLDSDHCIFIEFDEILLRAIVPPKIKATLAASLDKLTEKGFLKCIDPQDRTFSFPNQLIQTTIYELTPPRYANFFLLSPVHLCVQFYILFLHDFLPY